MVDLKHLVSVTNQMKDTEDSLLVKVPTDLKLEYLITLLRTPNDHPVIDFEDFCDLYAPLVPDIDNFLEDAYQHELNRDRSPENEIVDRRPTIIVKNVYDPGQLMLLDKRNPQGFYTQLRRLIYEERFNPGIRYWFLENGLRPAFWDKKGQNSPLNGAVTYVDVATGQFDKVLK